VTNTAVRKVSCASPFNMIFNINSRRLREEIAYILKEFEYKSE
jgi:hypothetical protein